MQVAYITNSDSASGVGHRAYAIARALENHGVLLRQVELDGVRGEIRLDGEVKLQRSHWPGLGAKKSLMWVRLGKALNEVLPTVDLYHFTNQSLSFLAARYRPSVVTVHDLIELTEPQQFWARPLNQYLHSGITRANRVVAVSEYTAASLKEYFPSLPPVTVLPNAVSAEFQQLPHFSESEANLKWRKRLGIEPTAQVILTVSSDHPRKNVATSLAAFAEVKKSFPEAVFVKVGLPGVAAGRDQLKEKSRELGIANDVTFIDHVTSAELTELYNLATVFIFTSRHEGFGLPPLQAMACGTPVISSSATALAEVVGSAALLAEPDEASAFVSHLTALLGDVAARDRLIQLGFQQVGKFSWERSAAGLAQVYEALKG